RLQPGVPGRAVAPGREDLHDLRGDERDPAAGRGPGDLGRPRAVSRVPTRLLPGPRRGLGWLRRAPWVGAPLPGEVAAAPTMLSIEEKQLLYVLARDYIRGEGAVVGAGCFLGGPTIALAARYAQNR